MRQFSILVVEDDADINALLCAILEKEGYIATAAFSGSEAMLDINAADYDLILLDLMLPGISGDELITRIRALKATPIIVLSARSGLDDKVDMLEKGADDYITKPFEIKEVAARVASQLRRNYELASSKRAKKLCFKDLTLERDSLVASIDGADAMLTPIEFEILWLLMGSPERVFTRENIYESVWKGEYMGEDNTVNVHISNIRQKLLKLNAKADYIKTVWGIGFKMNG